MTNPWPRRLAFFSALVAVSFAAVRVLHAPRPADEFSDLRDSVSDHRELLRSGHASLTCAQCHFAHAANSRRPLWQTGGAIDDAVFTREAAQAGGVKTGLCMSCHDGTLASGLQAHGAAQGSARPSVLGLNPGANHPVGVDYMAAFHRDPGSFNDPATNARIVLEEGKVGCLSCHAAHDRSSVSAGDVRTDVCIDCHRR